METAKTIDAKLDLAFEQFEKNNLNEAEEIYQACLDALDETSPKYLVALHWMGYVKSSLGKFDDARFIYLKLREIAISNSNGQDEQIAIHQLGMVERMAKNYDKAQAVFMEELNLLTICTPDFHLGFAANYYEQGYILLKKKCLIDAEKLMNQSLHYAEKANDPIGLGCSQRGLGEIFKAKGEQDKAKRYFKQAILSFEKGNEQIAVNEVIEMIDQIK